MSNVAEIEAAIAKLPHSQVEEVAQWLENFRQREAVPPQVVEDWLERASGAAIKGVTTEEIMKLTRGEE